MSYPRLATLTAGISRPASLAACSSVGSSSPSDRSTDVGSSTGDVMQGGTLTMAMSAEPYFLDPTLAGSFCSRFVFNAAAVKTSLERDLDNPQSARGRSRATW